MLGLESQEQRGGEDLYESESALRSEGVLLAMTAAPALTFADGWL